MGANRENQMSAEPVIRQKWLFKAELLTWK